ncbi:protein FAM110C [Megalops cyprinoides]|uniref:protein FAM110C n=1 Tax=Megalops cyprinoides TaxID=118141 RepID=UPI0018648DA2|nr:protein FAM110C [Megalops cyprinoides]
MQPTTDVDTSRILEKGPDYLRKQMELEGESKGRLSAVERLAASKPKYVKSQQVINSKQDPVVSFSSASGSSNGSSNPSSRRSMNKNVRCNPNQDVDGQGERAPPEVADMVRRSSSKKQRPDSLLMYRQKCELVKVSTNENAKASLVRRLFLNTLKDKTITVPQATVKECDHEERESASTESVTPNARGPQKLAPDVKRKPMHNRVEEIGVKCRKGVARSHSDISSRYSRNFSEFETFFKYCGLDGDVIESLGKENFSARSDELSLKIRSVSVSTSDDGFSRESGDSDGLLEEELHENIRQGTSVIERNARIIKWLYSCKNAQQSGKVLRDLD